MIGSPTRASLDSTTGLNRSHLPLVPFERYMVIDDRPGYPMAFVATVELRGTADRQALETAVGEAFERHPLLTAQLRRVGVRQQWEVGAAVPAIQWLDSGKAAESYLDERIDLSQTTGVRLAITQQDDMVVIRILFHHALCDGIGALRFIGDVLAYYGRHTADPGEQPTLLPLDPSTLPGRGQFDIRLPAPVTRSQVIRSLLGESWKVLCRRPSPLQATRQRGPAPATVAQTRVITLPRDIERQYRAAAARCGVTVNDLLLRDTFFTIRQWNEEHGRKPGRQWLRITVPTNLRYRHESRLPAANVLGYALMSRREHSCDESPEFLAGLAAEMEIVRKWGLGSLFVHAIAWIDRIPGLLWLLARSSRRFSTVVFSNVGNPVRRFRARFPVRGKRIRAGNLTLERLYGAPPIRPGTRVAFAINSYEDCLTIAMSHDRRWLSEVDAAHLLGRYRQQLERTAAQCDGNGAADALPQSPSATPTSQSPR